MQHDDARRSDFSSTMYDLRDTKLWVFDVVNKQGRARVLKVRGALVDIILESKLWCIAVRKGEAHIGSSA